jgi:RNA polymerase sigma-70 factor (ECF subfamily)
MVTMARPISSVPYTPAFGPTLVRSQPKCRPTDVIARAQAGDEDAFSEIYSEHKKRVYRICLRMVRDPWLAEDLSQEAFLQLHRKLQSFRGDSAFTTWLHRMTVNVVLMHLRKRVLPQCSLDQLMMSVPEERAGRGFGAPDLTQAGVVDRIAIDRALASLAPGYRNIFILHDMHGFQHREIASIEDCSLGNSKSQLHKARRALRSTLIGHATSLASADAGDQSEVICINSRPSTAGHANKTSLRQMD